MWRTRMGRVKDGEQTSSRPFFRAVEWDLLQGLEGEMVRSEPS